MKVFPKHTLLLAIGYELDNRCCTLGIVAEIRNTRTSKSSQMYVRESDEEQRANEAPPAVSESTRVHVDTDTRLPCVIFFC